MILDPGKLDQRITLQAPTPAPVGYSGQVKQHYASQAEVWAMVKGLGGRELRFAQQAASMATHVVTIRDYPGIRPDWRVQWRGRILNLEAVTNEDERDGFMVLNCIEQTTGG